MLDVLKQGKWWGGCGAVLTALALLAGCASQDDAAAAEPASQSPRPTQAEQDAAFYRAMVDRLASPDMQGRGAGYAGLDKARDLIAAYFASLGLRPVFVDRTQEAEDAAAQRTAAAAGEVSFTQAFDIAIGARAVAQRLAYAVDDADANAAADDPALTELKPGRRADYVLQGFTGQGAFGPSEVVFAGYGTASEEHDFNSYASAQPGELRGKAAIVFRYEPMTERGLSIWRDRTEQAGSRRRSAWSSAASLTRKAELATEHGASALIFVDPPAKQNDRPMRGTAQSDFGQRADVPVYQLHHDTFKRLVEAAGYDAGVIEQWQEQADAGQLDAFVLDGLRLAGAAEVERSDVQAHNVGAVLPGYGSLKNQWVVVGAHYDHLGFGEVGSRKPGLRKLHPGADDNASGATAVMLIARTLAQRYGNDGKRDSADKSDDDDGDPLGESAMPAVDPGRRSILFVAFSGEERGLLGSRHLLENIDALPFAIDEITAMVNFDMVGRLREDKLWLFGSKDHADWNPLVDAVNERFDFALQRPARAPGGSDHLPFHRKNIPALMFFSGLHPDYHTPADTPDKINAAGGARISHFAAEIVHRLSSEQRPLKSD